MFGIEGPFYSCRFLAGLVLRHGMSVFGGRCLKAAVLVSQCTILITWLENLETCIYEVSLKYIC